MECWVKNMHISRSVIITGPLFIGLKTSFFRFVFKIIKLLSYHNYIGNLKYGYNLFIV